MTKLLTFEAGLFYLTNALCIIVTIDCLRRSPTDRPVCPSSPLESGQVDRAARFVLVRSAIYALISDQS